MEFQVNAAGKRIYPSELKKQILEDLRGGRTAAELGRKYGIPVHNILFWKQAQEKALLGVTNGLPSEQMVPASEFRKLLEENKNLRRSLANMTLDRDILKEAHDIAVKKKWILPAK